MLAGTLLQAARGPEAAPWMRTDVERSERPVAGHEVRVLDEDDRTVASLETDERGRFRVELAPGSYRLAPRPLPGMLAGEGEAVEVREGEIACVVMHLDAGARGGG